MKCRDRQNSIARANQRIAPTLSTRCADVIVNPIRVVTANAMRAIAPCTASVQEEKTRSAFYSPLRFGSGAKHSACNRLLGAGRHVVITHGTAAVGKALLTATRGQLLQICSTRINRLSCRD